MRYTLLALLLTATPALAQADGPYGHMMGYGYHEGFFLGPLIFLILIVLAVAGAIWLFRHADANPARGASNARAELDMRLAKGEIDPEDYAARKKLLSE